jgi:low molecular weight phosphotyrosine protein phosphatase
MPSARLDISPGNPFQSVGRSRSRLEFRAMRILVVCTGNICRSPTAEGVLRKFLAQASLEEVLDMVEAASRGLLDHVRNHLSRVST